MKVTIKGQEYNFTFDSVWGPMYLYEEIVGEKMPFDPRKTACLHLLFYCILLRSNPGFDVSLEEFLIALNNLELANAMRDYYVKRMDVLTGFVSAEAEQEDDKKKECPRMKYLGLYADKVAAILNTLWIGWEYLKPVSLLKV